MRFSFCRKLASHIMVFCAVAPVCNAQSARTERQHGFGNRVTNGDPFLQRQNEPSIAVSTRKTLHLVAELTIIACGPAWIAGEYRARRRLAGTLHSFDEQSWQSTLIAGNPLDSSPKDWRRRFTGFRQRQIQRSDRGRAG